MYQMIICFILSVLIVLWIYFRWATREIHRALKDIPEIAPFPFIGGAIIFLGKSSEGICCHIFQIYIISFGLKQITVFFFKLHTTNP